MREPDLQLLLLGRLAGWGLPHRGSGATRLPGRGRGSLPSTSCFSLPAARGQGAGGCKALRCVSPPPAAALGRPPAACPVPSKILSPGGQFLQPLCAPRRVSRPRGGPSCRPALALGLWPLPLPRAGRAVPVWSHHLSPRLDLTPAGGWNSGTRSTLSRRVSGSSGCPE